MAEREGFEPSRRLPAYTRSRRAPSTTRPPLRTGPDYSQGEFGFKPGEARADLDCERYRSRASRIAFTRSSGTSPGTWAPGSSKTDLPISMVSW